MTMHHSLIDPSDPLGLLVVALGTIATAIAFVLAFRMTFWPGENEPDHAKRSILEEDR
jgi:hypothetical protein